MKAGSASIASHYHNKQQYDTLHERISEDDLHAGRDNSHGGIFLASHKEIRRPCKTRQRE